MKEDTVVALPRPGASVTDDPLLAVLREGARRMLMQAIEAEVEDSTAHGSLVDEQGRRRLVRNGHAPERQIQTGIGRSRCAGRRCATVAVPLVARSGSPRQYCRLTCGGPGISRNSCLALPEGRVDGSIRGSSGSAARHGCTGLSATTVRRLTEVWQEEHERWQGRDLSSRRYVYLWADGIYFTRDWSMSAVHAGVDRRGCTRPQRAAGDRGRLSRERQSWRELLLRLRDENGLKLDPSWPPATAHLAFGRRCTRSGQDRQQRCWVHKVANVLNKLPPSLQGKAKQDLHRIYEAANRRKLRMLLIASSPSTDRNMTRL